MWLMASVHLAKDLELQMRRTKPRMPPRREYKGSSDADRYEGNVEEGSGEEYDDDSGRWWVA